MVILQIPLFTTRFESDNFDEINQTLKQYQELITHMVSDNIIAFVCSFPHFKITEGWRTEFQSRP